MAEGAEEDLLRRERHDDGAHAVDGDAAVEERAGAVVVADRYGQFEHLRFQVSGIRDEPDLNSLKPDT